MKRVGIVALQGDFAAHAAALQNAGVETRELRRVADLEGLSGIVLPGGESTTLLNLMGDEPWFEALRRFHAGGGAIFGTCAGVILLAREVRPAQKSLALLDATVERNAYGRQVDSFESRLQAPALGFDIDAVFIRAPRFRALGPQVEVLAQLDGEPVLVRQDRILAATFHPELTASTALHRYFTELGADTGRQRAPRSAELLAQSA
ncbi:MAG TPA: pyridoxal 5'-phosphate synthase glutaminase subunit PdxT [Acidobacteriota bacterium]